MFKSVEPQPNFSKLETEVLESWRKNQTFSASLKRNQDKPPFVFFEGPPFANGKPGIHHVEARAFKDVILRYQALRGRHVVRRAGWDTHGLPVELEVEKQLGISGKRQIENLVPGDVTASIARFNALCRESVGKYKDEWEKFTERIGFWVDLNDAYSTYDTQYIESVWWALQKISKRNEGGAPLLYQGYKVLPYCPRCGTALSSHEVAQGYRSVKEASVYVRFRLRERRIQIRTESGEPEMIELDKPVSIVSWTTTPWTLPGNVALAVGEDIEYSLIRGEKEYTVVATALKDQVPGLAGKEFVRFAGRFLAGHSYEPLFHVPQLASEHSYKIYTAPFVTTQEGTGIVHTAVMYGEDDYQLGSRVGLPKFHTVGEDGRFVEALAELSGMPVKDAKTEKVILQHLKKTGGLIGELPHTHDYPYCWRCGTALLYYARDSWFIRMSALREQLQKNNDQITWVPEYIKQGRFGNWLAEIKDWAISRERYWGTPLPFWKCERQDCGFITIIGSIKELQEKALNFAEVYPAAESGIRNQELGPNSKFVIHNSELDLHRPSIDQVILKCDKCGGESKRVPEVLDVWFDSGAMPYAQWHYPFENEEVFASQFPADYISEGVDQTRGWFYTLLAIATALGEERPPYKSVISLGIILDEKGQKMSKSRGNTVDPMLLIDRYGGDILRWYMYSVNQPGETKRFAERDLVVLQRNLQLIFWNVVNYFVTYTNAAGWDVGKVPISAETTPVENVLDRWMLARLSETVNTVTQSLDELNVFRATRELAELITELSTWYVRRSRGREDSDFFLILYRCLATIAQLFAPFMPFFADAVWRVIRTSQDPESVHLTDWPQRGALGEAERITLLRMREVRAIVETVLAWRKKTGIKVRQPLGDLFVVVKSAELEPYLWLVGEELNFTNVRLAATAPEDASLVKLVVTGAAGSEVYLAPQITPSLRAQGIARELERHVQELRKRKGLKVGERVVLHYETDSQEIYEAFEFFDEGKTYITRVIGARVATPIEDELALAGHKVWLGLVRE